MSSKKENIQQCYKLLLPAIFIIFILDINISTTFQHKHPQEPWKQEFKKKPLKFFHTRIKKWQKNSRKKKFFFNKFSTQKNQSNFTQTLLKFYSNFAQKLTQNMKINQNSWVKFFYSTQKNFTQTLWLE